MNLIDRKLNVSFLFVAIIFAICREGVIHVRHPSFSVPLELMGVFITSPSLSVKFIKQQINTVAARRQQLGKVTLRIFVQRERKPKCGSFVGRKVLCVALDRKVIE